MKIRMAPAGVLTVLLASLALAGCNLNLGSNPNDLYITGDVLNSQNVPVPNATVIIAQMAVDSTFTPVYQASTNPGGGYTLNVRRPSGGPSYLYAEATGYVTSGKAEIPLNSNNHLVFNIVLSSGSPPPPTTSSVVPGGR